MASLFLFLGPKGASNEVEKVILKILHLNEQKGTSRS